MAKVRKEKDGTTEDKIKEAARKVFTQKGYAATRTRDIAEESGYNLALLNYYFKSKEKLFDIVMLENLQVFIHNVMGILNDTTTTLREKIEQLISHYIDMLIKNPEIPLFVLSELRTDPKKLITKIGSQFNIADSCLAKQWREMVKAEKITLNPVHMVMNVAAMTIFPFVASPMIQSRGNVTAVEFNQLMEERKKLIPEWIFKMIKK